MRILAVAGAFFLGSPGLPHQTVDLIGLALLICTLAHITENGTKLEVN